MARFLSLVIAAIHCGPSGSVDVQDHGRASTSPPSVVAPPAASAPDGSPAAAAPRAAAPVTELGVAMTTRAVPVDSGVTVDVDVHAPTTGGSYPLVLLRHGLTRSKENLAGWGKLLASRGYVAIMPDARSSWRDVPEPDARDVLTVMKWALHEPSIAGKIDPSRRVLGGHSSGGLVALVAASEDASLRALVLLDTEGDDLGARDGAKVLVPTLGVFTDPSMICNESGTGVASFQAVTGPRFGLRIKGASHCAAESPSGVGCEALCGTATPQALAIHEQFVLSFLDAYVKCDGAAFASVDPRLESPAGVEIFSSDNRGTPEAACASKP